MGITGLAFLWVEMGVTLISSLGWPQTVILLILPLPPARICPKSTFGTVTGGHQILTLWDPFKSFHSPLYVSFYSPSWLLMIPHIPCSSSYAFSAFLRGTFSPEIHVEVPGPYFSYRGPISPSDHPYSFPIATVTNHHKPFGLRQ
jgi:hypothetical protein